MSLDLAAARYDAARALFAAIEARDVPRLRAAIEKHGPAIMRSDGLRHARELLIELADEAYVEGVKALVAATRSRDAPALRAAIAEHEAATETHAASPPAEPRQEAVRHRAPPHARQLLSSSDDLAAVGSMKRVRELLRATAGADAQMELSESMTTWSEERLRAHFRARSGELD